MKVPTEYALVRLLFAMTVLAPTGIPDDIWATFGLGVPRTLVA